MDTNINTTTASDETGYTYSFDWVAVTFRGYNEEPAVCGSYAEVLDFIASDDEGWEYVPALRVRCFPTDYGDDKTARSEGHLIEALAYVKDGVLPAQTEIVWPTRGLRLEVPESYRREVETYGRVSA